MSFDAEEMFVLHPEREGQTRLVNADVLPRSMSTVDREFLEAAGVVFLGERDELFYNVTLPTGWQKVPTFEPRLSILVDERNRERARIFYKASAHDRKASLNLCSRYNVRDWTSDEILRDTGIDFFVREICDGSCALLSTGVSLHSVSVPVPDEREDKKARWRAHRAAVSQATFWLEMHYPNHRDPFAYWD